MKVRILREIYVKRSCEKKSKDESGNCAVLDPDTKKQTSCYDDCDTARAAKHATNEEQLEEITVAGNVAGVAGGFPSKVVKDFNDKEKEESELDGKPMTEMFSTSQMKSSVLNKKGLTMYLRGRRKEHSGHVERSRRQGLRNVMEDDGDTEPLQGFDSDRGAGQGTVWKLTDFADNSRNASRTFDVLKDIEENIGLVRLGCAILSDKSAKNRIEIMSSKFGYDQDLYEKIEEANQEAIKKYYQFLINEFLFWISYNPMSSAQQYAGRHIMLSKPTKDLAYAHIHRYVSNPNQNNPKDLGGRMSKQADFYKLEKDLDPALYDLPEE